MSSSNIDQIPTYIRATYVMVQCAFPSGIPEGEYSALLYILHTSMSDRVLAEVMTYFTPKNAFEALHDVMSAASDPPSTETVERVQQRLNDCGYEQWLAEEV
jgi:hypothetical protein